MKDIEPLYPYPTAQVQAYVDVMGIPTTIEFLLNFGGAELALSADPKGKGMLEKCIGYENTKRLYDVPHLQKRVPLASKWLAKCLSQGLSKAACACRT